eukprot:4161778-Amphidinium_carterae.1
MLSKVECKKSKYTTSAAMTMSKEAFSGQSSCFVPSCPPCSLMLPHASVHFLLDLIPQATTHHNVRCAEALLVQLSLSEHDSIVVLSSTMAASKHAEGDPKHGECRPLWGHRQSAQLPSLRYILHTPSLGSMTGSPSKAS